MIKRILRSALGVIFLFVFMVTLLLGAVRFRLLDDTFWKTAFDKGEVYQLLQTKVSEMKVEFTARIQREAGGRQLPRQLTDLLAVADTLTAARFRELVETNLDRVTAYLNGETTDLFLYLPVAKWKLPVKALGQDVLANLSEETPFAAVVPIVIREPEQQKNTIEFVGKLHGLNGKLVIVLGIIFLVAGVILAGHFFLGQSLSDRVTGTGWLLFFSGVNAKLIALSAGSFFELVAKGSKPPMESWLAQLGRSLVGQFFDFGGTAGLVVGTIGLVMVGGGWYLAKKEKVKAKKQKMGLIKGMIASTLGVVLGLLIIFGGVASVVVAFGGKFDFSVGREGSPVTEAGTTGRMKEYKSAAGWMMSYPSDWESIKDENSEGFVKKPKQKTTDWAAVEVKTAGRPKQVDGGGVGGDFPPGV